MLGCSAVGPCSTVEEEGFLRSQTLDLVQKKFNTLEFYVLLIFLICLKSSLGHVYLDPFIIVLELYVISMSIIQLTEILYIICKN
jgi:hypothetical protein